MYVGDGVMKDYDLTLISEPLIFFPFSSFCAFQGFILEVYLQQDKKKRRIPHFCFWGEAHTRSVLLLSFVKIKRLAEGLAVLEVAAADGNEKFLQTPILPDYPP
jgi:hypothetical protein